MNTVIALAMAMLLAEAGHADEGSGWGRAGTLLLSGGISLERSGSSFGGSDLGAAYAVGVEAQFFVVRSLLVGLEIDFRRSEQTAPVVLGSGGVISATRTITTLGLEPLIGINFDLTSSISLLPKAFFEYDMDWIDSSGMQRTWLGLSVPFVLHVPYFFIGFGPAAFVKLSNPGQTNLFLRTSLGAWF